MNLTKRILVSFLLLAAECLQAADDPAVLAVNQFGLSCLNQVKGNSLLSPWSLQSGLAMAHAGANGRTAEEMTKALAYSSDAAAMQVSFQKLREDLSRSGAGASSEKALHSANAIFVGRDVVLDPAWLELTSSYFDAETRYIDFTMIVEAAVQINEWVMKKTNGMIPIILLPADLSGRGIPPPALTLVNAIAFDSPWDELFTKELTKDDVFHDGQGNRTTVPLMFKQHALPYAQKNGFQITALPYAGGQIQFVVFLPDAIDGLAAMEAKLNAALLQECISLSRSQVRLSLPRIKLEPPPLAMKGILQKLGMKLAFNREGADFSNMSSTKLHIAQVHHRAVMGLNESGTKAASSSAAVMRPKNGAPKEIPHKVVKADHPFVFAIQHVPSGACLFMGRVTSPPGGTPVSSSPAPKK